MVSAKTVIDEVRKGLDRTAGWLRGSAGRAVLVIALATASLAWDTKDKARIGEFSREVADRDKWHAVYYCHRSLPQNCRENEHAWLALVALERASPGSPWGFSPDNELYVHDLATGYYREQIGNRPGAVWDEGDVMGIPRRLIPGAPNFAGVPDFSYTIYDWINKNELCPPLPTGQMPAGTPGDCHNYTYWQGGGFNASHFGSQASRTYARLHATALSAARRAQALRTAISTDLQTLELYRDVVREAEMEALAYEGYAQHFLQDRWAIGHMFDRWGSPEYNAGGIALDPTRALMAGAFTGIIHGYESVLHVPDALSSPEVGFTNALVNLARRGLNRIGAAIGLVERSDPPPVSLYVPEWRHRADEETHPGVGDYRAHDMQRSRYRARANFPGHSLEYNSETGLNVRQQYREFMACSSSGFRQVIEAFGRNGGGFGVDEAILNSNVSSQMGGRCFDMWATNESMLAGMGPEFALAGGVSTLAQAGFRIGDAINRATGNATTADLPPEIRGFVSSRNNTLSVSRIYVHARLRAYVSPNGIDLAQGGMLNLLSVPTGDTYPIASYLEPADIASLPAADPRGRDAQSVYGFFNRAHADHFCAQSGQLLPTLRRQAPDNNRAMCRILGQRIYQRTRQDTPLVEEYMSTLLNGDRLEVAPLCQLASSGWSAPDFGEDSLAELHPGYVPWDFDRRQSSAFSMADGDMSYQSVANWCDETPVVDFEADETLRAEGIVAVIADTRDELTIRGMHFGRERGALKLGTTRANAVEITEISRWRDGEIRFSVEDVFADIPFDNDALTYAFIERSGTDEADPGRRSAGRFAIRRDVRPPEIALLEVSGEEREFYYRYVDLVEEDAADEAARDIWIFDREPPESPDPEDLAFWPVPAGENLQIEIRFNTSMEDGGEGESFVLAGQTLDGEWINNRTWRAEWQVPAAELFDGLRGGQNFSISARSDRGALTDADPQRGGEQADTNHHLLLDTLPVHVTSLAVRGRGQTVYQAEWNGGPDYEAERSLTHMALGDPERMLDVAVARQAPAEGRGELRLELSGEVDEPPEVTVGGAAVDLEGAGRRWRGRFDFAEANTVQDENGDLPVNIRVGTDRQDADPRTAVVINDPQNWSSGLFWLGLENSRGGSNSDSGGADTWHRIGPAPGLSLLIVLDASGSMDENDRMANARAGITQTFANLPEDQVIEFAAVVFTDCGSFSTRSFTRDADAVRQFLTSQSPSGGTPLAAAHDQASNMFASLADPRSQAWSYASFTDGAETCDGNVAASVRNLEALLNRHQAPETEPPEEPDAPEPPVPAVNCQAATWRGYAVEVEDGGRHLDRITLVEHNYLERALPDGRCIARYEQEIYGVYHGSIRNHSGGPTRSRWGINSRPSETTSDFGTSRRGEADLLRVRNAADAARGGLVDLGQARQQIETAVSNATPESG